MDTDSLEKFKRICDRIRADMLPATQWQWDEDYNMVLTVVEDATLLMDTVSKNLEYKWEYDSNANGPQSRIYERALSLFGIIPSQIIFSTEEVGGLVLFAVCWPWGKGKNASLRIGVFSRKQPSSNMSDVNERLAKWFGIDTGDTGWSDFTV